MNLCPKNVPKWMQEEYRYRYEERLGIMCEDRVPTTEQERIANEEAQTWLDKAMKDANL